MKSQTESPLHDSSYTSHSEPAAPIYSSKATGKKIQDLEKKLQDQDQKIQNQDQKIQDQDQKVQDQDLKLKDEDWLQEQSQKLHIRVHSY